MGLISRSDQEIFSQRFKIGTNEWVRLATPPSRRLTYSSSYYSYPCFGVAQMLLLPIIGGDSAWKSNMVRSC